MSSVKPCIRTLASTPYGSPFTDSVDFLPDRSGADRFKFQFRIPDKPAIEVKIAGNTALHDVIALIEEGLKTSGIRILRNGSKVSESVLKTGGVSNLFHHTAEFEIEGVRYSVNEGRRLSASGSEKKRSKLTWYGYLTAGGISMLVACLWFWKTVIPEDQQRKM